MTAPFTPGQPVEFKVTTPGLWYAGTYVKHMGGFFALVIDARGIRQDAVVVREPTQRVPDCAEEGKITPWSRIDPRSAIPPPVDGTDMRLPWRKFPGDDFNEKGLWDIRNARENPVAENMTEDEADFILACVERATRS